MAERITERGSHGNILHSIYEGMAVYDATNNRIGKVDRVYLGAQEDSNDAASLTDPAVAPDEFNENTFVDMIANVFDTERVPPVLARRLLMQGFIKINTAGLFSNDRYATPDQIAAVNDDQVHLAVERNGLIKESEIVE